MKKTVIYTSLFYGFVLAACQSNTNQGTSGNTSSSSEQRSSQVSELSTNASTHLRSSQNKEFERGNGPARHQSSACSSCD